MFVIYRERKLPPLELYVHTNYRSIRRRVLDSVHDKCHSEENGTAIKCIGDGGEWGWGTLSFVVPLMKRKPDIVNEIMSVMV